MRLSIHSLGCLPDASNCGCITPFSSSKKRLFSVCVGADGAQTRQKGEVSRAGREGVAKLVAKQTYAGRRSTLQATRTHQPTHASEPSEGGREREGRDRLVPVGLERRVGAAPFGWVQSASRKARATAESGACPQRRPERGQREASVAGWTRAVCWSRRGAAVAAAGTGSWSRREQRTAAAAQAPQTCAGSGQQRPPLLSSNLAHGCARANERWSFQPLAAAQAPPTAASRQSSGSHPPSKWWTDALRKGEAGHTTPPGRGAEAARTTPLDRGTPPAAQALQHTARNPRHKLTERGSRGEAGMYSLPVAGSSRQPLMDQAVALADCNTARGCQRGEEGGGWLAESYIPSGGGGEVSVLYRPYSAI
jgi:hypothetical protein